jgi:hypothetical protein
MHDFIGHAHRVGPQSHVAPDHPVARELPRRRQDQEAHSRQSDHWPGPVVEGLRLLLRGGVALARADEALTIGRSLPRDQVAAVLGTAQQIGLAKLLTERGGGAASRRYRDLAIGLIVNRVIQPASKLATVRALNPATAASSLGERLRLGVAAEREVYETLDWLLERQEGIENALARRHLAGGTAGAYDVCSSYLEGRCCALAEHGYMTAQRHRIGGVAREHFDRRRTAVAVAQQAVDDLRPVGPMFAAYLRQSAAARSDPGRRPDGSA